MKIESADTERTPKPRRHRLPVAWPGEPTTGSAPEPVAAEPEADGNSVPARAAVAPEPAAEVALRRGVRP